MYLYLYLSTDPIAELPDAKVNIRSALSRATKQRKVNVATSSDEHFLYV